MIELTQQQSQQLGPNLPLAFDPRTNETYVLVRKEIFERMKGLLYDDSEGTAEEMRLMLARSAEANGWNEPEMDAYDNYDEYRAKQCPWLSRST